MEDRVQTIPDLCALKVDAKTRILCGVESAGSGDECDAEPHYMGFGASAQGRFVSYPSKFIETNVLFIAALGFMPLSSAYVVACGTKSGCVAQRKLRAAFTRRRRRDHAPSAASNPIRRRV
jgi:hypothetical protein